MKAAVAIVSFLCLVSCGPRTAPKVTQSGRVIALSDSLLRADRADTIDLGRLRAGEVVVQELRIRNDGDRTLVITDVASNCGCTTVEFPRQPVKPGEEAPFSFRFDTRGFTGRQHKVIRIRTSMNNRARRLIVTAEVE